MADNSTLELVHTVAGKLGRPVRLILIGLLAFALLIPLAMVRSVVSERHQTHRGVVTEIAGSWSNEQLIGGPFLIVPFHERVEVTDEYVTPEGERRSMTRWESERRKAILLPDELGIVGRIDPETRNRGIYEVQVYTAGLVVSGEFGDLGDRIRSLVPADSLEEIEWHKAVLGFGLSDPRGITDVDGFEFNGEGLQPGPGTTASSLVSRGFNVAVGTVMDDHLEFRMPMTIRGSENLQFLPLGGTTRASLTSVWSHPSFIGEVLPSTRELGDSGFKGEWNIPLLSRSYPQQWIAGRSVNINEVRAGVRLFEAVALYDLVTRSVKYGLLFIVLTFLTLGLMEHITGSRLSPVQFLLIGIALAMFFLILIALAEHLGFPSAYLLASATVIVINTVYCAAIMTRKSLAIWMAGVLSAIYGVLYTILKAEDYALLGGTALLVVALVVTMFFTRKLNREPEAETRTS